MTKSPDTDITTQVTIHSHEDEIASVGKCICGAEFHPWVFVITNRKQPRACPECGRRLYCVISVKVFEVQRK